MHDVVKAKKFEVIGKEGKRFIVLMSKSQNSTSEYGSITIYNEKQRRVLSLNSYKGDGSITVNSKLGRSVASLHVIKGVGVVSVNGSSSRSAKVYITSRNGNGLVNVNGPKNKRRVRIRHFPYGSLSGEIQGSNGMSPQGFLSGDRFWTRPTPPVQGDNPISMHLAAFGQTLPGNSIPRICTLVSL